MRHSWLEKILTLSYETVFDFETLIQTLWLCQKIKSSIFLPTFLAVRYFRQQEPGAPLSMCFITPLWFEVDWRGSHLFASHPSCLLFYLLPSIQMCTPSLRVVLLTVPSFLWIDSSIAQVLYWGGWEFFATGDVEKEAGKHLSAGVLLSSSFPDTSREAGAGCWAGSSLWPHGAGFAYYLGVSHLISSQNCLAHIRTHLFLSGMSSWHAEMSSNMLCLHRTFGRRSGTCSLHRASSFPAEHNKAAVWLGIQTSIFGSIFVGRSIIFADNLSSGQNLSITLPRLIDDFLELVLQSRLLSTASSRGSARAAWAVNDCVHRQLGSCSVLRFYGCFFLLIMSNSSHPGAVSFPSPCCLGCMNLLETVYLTLTLPG